MFYIADIKRQPGATIILTLCHPTGTLAREALRNRGITPSVQRVCDIPLPRLSLISLSQRSPMTPEVHRAIYHP